ncbi:MAG: mandelate racemase/muconate lactonizing enzyme family protein [Streptosporangiales bacterium]|nr:mandelate racemase/muconate lactonizing enzyme family protein [Streptosporangiales bacterium]
MYELTDVRARAHRAPFTVPLLDEPIGQRTFVTCRIETDGGLTGFGLTGQFLPHAVVAALTEHITPLLRGVDIRDTEAVHARVAKALNQRNQTGVISSAMSALDIAMWDAAGKGAGRTIAQLLGGHRDRAAAYVTFGFPQYDRDQLVEAARLQVRSGVGRLKMVVAVHPDGWREDANRIRAVRAAVGDDVELAIDANYLFSPTEALLLCRAVEDCGIVWFEEPLHGNDVRAMADLRRRTNIPLSAGQMDGHLLRLREFVDAQAVDIIQPNVCYCGGYTEARRVGHLAQAFSLPIANGGGWPHFNMHLIAGLRGGWRVEFHLGMQQVGEQIFPDAPRPKDDEIVLPDAPGLGMTVDTDFLDATVLTT